MFAFLEILRPSVCALAAAGVLVGALVAGFNSPYIIALACLVAVGIAGAGNITNDIFDYKIDKINRPKRPLPSGRVSKKAAKLYAGALFVAANFLALIFLNVFCLGLALLNTAITIFYAAKLKRTPFGNFFDSWLASSTFIFGSLLIAGINPTVIILAIMAFSANFGREIAKAIEDIKGDAKAKLRTIPIVAGRNFSIWIAIIFVFFAITFSPVPYLLKLLSINYLYLVILADIIFVIACFLLFFNVSKSQRAMKIAMGIGILAFLIGLI